MKNFKKSMFFNTSLSFRISNTLGILMLCIIFFLINTPALAQKSDNRFNLKIAPVLEYMHLIQTNETDPFAPEDTGFLYGLNLNFEALFLNEIIAIFGNLKYTFGVLEYDGSFVDEDGMSVRELDVRSDYYLTDIDLAIGSKIKLSKSTAITPYIGYKFWRWNNKLDPKEDLVHEISTTKGPLAGLKYSYQWNKNTTTYINGLVLFNSKTNIEFRTPNFADLELGRETSYNLEIGQIWNNWFSELKFSKYKTGPGIENNQQVKTPVTINLFSFSIGYVF